MMNRKSSRGVGIGCWLVALGLVPVLVGACGSSAATAGVDAGGDGGTGPTKDAASDTGSQRDTGSQKDTGAKPDVGTTGTPDTGNGGHDSAVDVVTHLPDASMPDASINEGDAGKSCGNGTLDPGEQCDDGNTFDLDGCDSHCRYEMVTRMTSISISGTTAPSFCLHTGNALGHGAITSLALGQLNKPLATDVTNGTVNVFTQFFDLSDLTGVSATNFQIGVLDGKLDPMKGTWPTAGNPIDWWFLADPTAVSQGVPVGLLGGGTLASGALTAGPSTVNVDLTLGGSLAALTMRDAKISATVDATPAPDAPAPPPAKLATGLTTFQTVSATAAGEGLCGDITVQSIAQIPVPSALTTGTTKCAESYTYCGASMPVGPSCNSLLDVIVGGCKVFGLAAVNPTQPDVPAVGSTSVQTLTVGAGKKVTIPSGQETEAYSAYLQFAANRAHFTGESCTTSTECQTGQTCGAASVCTP